MAMRVGIDLVCVEIVRASIREHGESYLSRVYTATEREDCQGPDGPMAERLAARFAAKEATLKVLRPQDEAIPWNTLEVVRHPAGWVELALSGRAMRVAARQGLEDFAVSLSHEGDYATAVVLARQA